MTRTNVAEHGGAAAAEHVGHVPAGEGRRGRRAERHGEVEDPADRRGRARRRRPAGRTWRRRRRPGAGRPAPRRSSASGADSTISASHASSDAGPATRGRQRGHRDDAGAEDGARGEGGALRDGHLCSCDHRRVAIGPPSGPIQARSRWANRYMPRAAVRSVSAVSGGRVDLHPRGPLPARDEQRQLARLAGQGGLRVVAADRRPRRSPGARSRTGMCSRRRPDPGGEPHRPPDRLLLAGVEHPRLPSRAGRAGRPRGG